MEVVLVVVIALAVVGLAVWAHQQEKKRVASLVAWGRQVSMTLLAERLPDPAWPYGLFQRGHSRYAQVVLRCDWPQATPGLGAGHMVMFEYHYAVTTGSGKNRRTHHYWHTCALVDLSLQVGHVSVEREGLGDKLAAVFGFDDLDFEDAEFSKRFKVQAETKKDAWTLLDGAMMRWWKDHAECRLETRGREALVVLESSGKASAERFLALKEWTTGFLAQMPRVLVNAERTRQGLPPIVEAGNASMQSRAERSE